MGSERSNEDAYFAFHVFKADLTRVLCKFNYVVEDEYDFWIFARKYEEVAQKKNSDGRNSKEEPNAISNKLNIPTKYDPSYLNNVTFTIPNEEMQKCLSVEKKHTLRKNLPKFCFLIGLYVNFKQKEKLATLKKIRIAQQNLPVYQYKDEILHAVSNEKVVIIAGDTGCGKSTQIPQYLWQAGYNSVVCSQPRRIACVSLSKRVTCETLTQFSAQVGYQIRFEKKKTCETKILFITEGLLLRQASNEGMLSDYDVIILDEVHERHLQGDFLLGVTKCIMHHRNDVKLVLMSATINIDLFANYFGNMAKVLRIPGRLFPIDVQYFPIAAVDSTDRFDPSPYVRILQLIDKKYSKEERGDVLMFLSGTKEITAVVDAVKQYNEKWQTWCILPLHSSMSLTEQDKVFDYPPEGFRKCVVATNIAETSVTIDGIRFVVDSGKVKEMSYDMAGRLQRLKEFWISKASAEQRKGRAGRTGPGVCFRLYSENDYTALNEYTTPEIQRVSLDSVLLQMIAMGLPDVRKFPFIESPGAKGIDDSLLSLKQHGAITEGEKLTEMGRTLSKLPVDIQLGKMLVMGSLFDQVEPILSLAAALSVQSPYTNKAFRDSELQEARSDLESDHGDPITVLNAFREWLQLKHEVAQEGGSSAYKSRKWCKRRGFEEQRFYEMTKLRSQFKDLLLDCGLINEDGTSKKSNEELTSAERSARHGELKQLRKLKRAHQNENVRKPKILKPDYYFEVEFHDVEEEDTSTDMRDIEFRLRNDSRRVKHLLQASTANSYKNLTLLKIIFSAALYPQMAMPDEYNTSKTVKDQLFHTREKPFVSLHPNSFFASHPHILLLDDSDIIHPTVTFTTKLSFSSRHQILFYIFEKWQINLDALYLPLRSLLETTKVYLVNNLRMPAAQSILLFSRAIRTNRNLTKFYCDHWIELRFVSPLAGEKFIIEICKIRCMWEKLLNSRLQKLSVGKLDEQIIDGLLKLLRADASYTIRRLLPADLKSDVNLLNECEVALHDENPFYEDFTVARNSKYGGVDVAPFLTYDCIPSEAEDEFENWKCDECETVFALSPFERLRHLRSHAKSNENESTGTAFRQTVEPRRPNTRLYECSVCQKKLYLTSTEILKHRREHVNV